MYNQIAQEVSCQSHAGDTTLNLDEVSLPQKDSHIVCRQIARFPGSPTLSSAPSFHRQGGKSEMQDYSNHTAVATAVSSLMIFEAIVHSLAAVLDHLARMSAVHFLGDRRLL